MIHLAWGGLPNYLDASHLEQELPRQLTFLNSCLDNGLERLTVTGTCQEYGMREGVMRESDVAVPATAYAQAKDRLLIRLNESPLRNSFGLNWLRLFYLYGHGQSSSSLYSQLRAAIATGAPRFDMSGGQQVRDFLPIEVAAEYIAAISVGCRDAGVVNICSGRPKTVHETVTEWIRGCGASIVLNRGVYQYPTYEPFAFWGDATKLESLRKSA